MEVRQPGTPRVVEIEEFDDPADDYEPVFRREEPPESRLPKFGPGLRTAAEMVNDGPRRADVDPDAFRQGMVVLHPEYGLGKVVALGGSGGERTATIDFASAAGRKKIPLAGSLLRPVK
jgi:DNA helicase-2/ATP-dependent DNA helicase PcrA